MNYIIIFFIQILLLFQMSRGVTSNIHNLLRKIFRNEKITNYIFALIFLPGTILHELSHYLMALFLFVRTGEMELIPEKHEDGLKMGSVEIAKSDFIRRFFIGVAPVITGILIIFFVVKFSLSVEILKVWYVRLVILYLLFVIGNTMFSSKEDMKGWYKMVVFLALVYAVFYIAGISVSFDKFILKITLVMQNAVWYFLPVLLIDLIILLLFSKFKKHAKN